MIRQTHRETGFYYEQIKEKIRRFITGYALAEGEKLPSVPELASKLAVNPNMILQVYLQLEQEGYIHKVDERSFAVSKGGREEMSYKKELMQEFDQVVVKLSRFSVTPEEMKRRVAELTEGENSFD